MPSALPDSSARSTNFASRSWPLWKGRPFRRGSASRPPATSCSPPKKPSSALPDVRSGAIPAISLVFIAKRVGEARARELALRGQPLSATDAFTIGLVNVGVPRARIDATLARLASALVSDNSGNAMALCKELLSRVMGMNLAEALDFAANMHAASRMTAECRKGMTAYPERRNPGVVTTVNIDLRSHIRSVPGFPKPGIVFRDITTLLKDPAALRAAVDQLEAFYRDRRVATVVGIESRGFVLGAALAYRLGAGFVPVRKPGKLPAETLRESYSLEYGTDAVEIHATRSAGPARPAAR